MSDSMQSPSLTIHRMRDAGRHLIDQGLFEFNLVTGQFTWANSFALEKFGYTLEQIQSLSVFDIVPEIFHDAVRDNIADTISGRQMKFFIWPGKTGEGKIIWWYVFQTETHHPTHWSYADLIQTTDDQGVAFAFMRTAMATTNSYGQLHYRVNEMDTWMKNQVQRLDVIDSDIKQSISTINQKMQHAINAATKAADQSLITGKALSNLEISLKNHSSNMEDRFSAHTGEIIRLMSNDTLHDKRIETFESHVRETTELAVKAITIQADSAAKGLSKKVAIPVSGIAALATLCQWVIQNWPWISKHFH